MRILYSKNAVKRMLTLRDDQVSRILKAVQGTQTVPPTTQVFPVPGYSDRRMLVRAEPWTVLLKYTEFKGKNVLYVMEVMDKEDLEYYFN